MHLTESEYRACLVAENLPLALIPPPFLRDVGWITSPGETCAVSVSQIETALHPKTGCWRKWGFEKIDGFRTSSAAAELGSAVHKQRENWLKHGTPFDLTTKEGEIAMAGIELLPNPGECLVEHPFEIWIRERIFDVGDGRGGLLKPKTVDGGLLLRGVVDLIYETHDGDHGEAVAHVDDHKTHGGRYPIRTEEDLRADAQWNTYVSWAFSEFGLVQIETTWHYLRTVKPYRCDPVRVSARADDPRIMAKFGEVLEAGLLIESARRFAGTSPDIRNVNDLTPNTRACGAYGGCKHMDRCRLPEASGDLIDLYIGNQIRN